MLKKTFFILSLVLIAAQISAQGKRPRSLTTGRYGDGPDSIAPAGIIQGLNDEQLLELVQKQTFRFFWHGAHPHSGLALERSNTVLAEHYWDYINEAWDEPNFSRTSFGPDAGAIGGTGFGIMSTIVAVERGWIGRDTAVRRLGYTPANDAEFEEMRTAALQFTLERGSRSARIAQHFARQWVGQKQLHTHRNAE